jgi:hypothetical protein
MEPQRTKDHTMSYGNQNTPDPNIPDPLPPPARGPEYGPGIEYGPGLEYGRMVSYAFESPKWFLNLLLMGVCQLIPIIGPIVLLGYQFDVVESLHRYRQGRAPDFDFNRFVDYLTRGVWPFLVVLVASLVLVPVIWIVVALLVGLGVMAGFAGGPGAAILLGILLLVLMIAIQLLIFMVMIPLQLRAGLSQDFGTAFNFGFIKSFVATTWKECVLGALFLIVVGIGATVIGFALCCVGVLFTVSVVYLAQAHFHFQLYELYLSRGGEEIPLKPPKDISPTVPPSPPR